ncbi:hypothetical protein [Streptomyces sp. NPDC004230]
MPRQIDQLPTDATTLARKVRDLERQMAELRASRRAAYTTISEGAFKVVSPDGETYALLQHGQLVFGSETVPQLLPTGVLGTADGGTLDLQSGCIEGGAQAHLILASGDSPLASGDGAPFVSLEWDGTSGPNGADMVFDIGGILSPRSMAWGMVTITPSAANTPTSSVITGLNIRGNTFFAFTSPSTVTPGSTTAANGVTGTGTSSVTSTGLTVWLTRQNTTATGVNWLVIGL